MGKKEDPVISSFVRVVKKQFPDSRIILFGSRAKKSARKQSDYDFLVVSSAFQKWDWEKRSAKLYLLKRNIPAAMDILCLTPQELEEQKHKLGVIQQAVREGVEVAN